jgi:hypothetical protein
VRCPNCGDKVTLDPVSDVVNFLDHTVLIVLGIDADGAKHVLGLREGTTENRQVAKELLPGSARTWDGRAAIHRRTTSAALSGEVPDPPSRVG